MSIPHHTCCAWCRGGTHAEAIYIRRQYQADPLARARAIADAYGWTCITAEYAPEASLETWAIDITTRRIVPVSADDQPYLLVFTLPAAPPTRRPVERAAD